MCCDRDGRVSIQRRSRVCGASGVVRIVSTCAIVEDDRSACGADPTRVGRDQTKVFGSLVDRVVHDGGTHEQLASRRDADGAGVSGPLVAAVEVLQDRTEVRIHVAVLGGAFLQGQRYRLSCNPRHLEHRKRRAFVDENVVDAEGTVVIERAAGGVQVAIRDGAVVDVARTVVANGGVAGIGHACHIRGCQAQGFGTFGDAVLQHGGAHKQLARAVDGRNVDGAGIAAPSAAVVILEVGQHIAADGGRAIAGCSRRGQ